MSFFEAATEQGALRGRGRVRRVRRQDLPAPGLHAGRAVHVVPGCARPGDPRASRRLTDQRYLDVQPKRIELVPLDREMGLPEFDARATRRRSSSRRSGSSTASTRTSRCRAGWPSGSWGAGCRTEVRLPARLRDKLSDQSTAAHLIQPSDDSWSSVPSRRWSRSDLRTCHGAVGCSLDAERRRRSSRQPAPFSDFMAFCREVELRPARGRRDRGRLEPLPAGSGSARPAPCEGRRARLQAHPRGHPADRDLHGRGQGRVRLGDVRTQDAVIGTSRSLVSAVK